MHRPNVLILVLDSLRYDVAAKATTPNLQRLFYAGGAGTWRKVYAPGTYTLPSHMSMFQAGLFPSDPHSQEPVYNHRLGPAFKGRGDLFSSQPSLFEVPSGAENIVKGMSMLGYETLGLGGVGWFDSRMATTELWAELFFDSFHWDPAFHETEPQAFERQIDLLKAHKAAGNQDTPLFLFINCPSTHTPYCGFERSVRGQARALRYVDQHIPALFGLLPHPLHVFIMADHGDCFGEEGLWGHSIYHPKVMEVPMIHFRLEQEVAFA